MATNRWVLDKYQAQAVEMLDAVANGIDPEDVMKRWGITKYRTKIQRLNEYFPGFKEKLHRACLEHLPFKSLAKLKLLQDSERLVAFIARGIDEGKTYSEIAHDAEISNTAVASIAKSAGLSVGSGKLKASKREQGESPSVESSTKKAAISGAPMGAQWYCNGLYYKIGARGKVFFWSGFGWIASTNKSIPSNSYKV